MPRIPYLPAETTEPRAVVDAIRQRRGGELLELDRMLLYSPPFAEGWNALLTEVRGKLSLPGRLRELVICAVAALNRADYELLHHGPVFLEEGGTEGELTALHRLGEPNWNGSVFTEADHAVIRFTLEVTRSVRPSNEAFAAARAALDDDRQMVELVGLIGTYNMVSRFLVGLGVGE